jgi:hypothetical protein
VLPVMICVFVTMISWDCMHASGSRCVDTHSQALSAPMNITSTEHHVLSSRWSVDGYGTTRGCRSVPVCLAGFALPMLSDCCWRAVVCGAAAVELPCCCLWSCCKGGLGPFVFTAALYRPGRPLTADGCCKCYSTGCLESAVSQTYRLSSLQK